MQIVVQCCVEHHAIYRKPQRKLLLSQTNITAPLKFSKESHGTPQHHWENLLWTDETKVELFGFICHKKGTAYQCENIPKVKYSGGNIMI